MSHFPTHRSDLFDQEFERSRVPEWQLEMTDIESVYKLDAPDVRRFALFLSGDPVMADEITSNTFVRAWLARQPTLRT